MPSVAAAESGLLRGGGRVRAIPHIAPAEEMGIEMLEGLIEKELKG